MLTANCALCLSFVVAVACKWPEVSACAWADYPAFAHPAGIPCGTKECMAGRQEHPWLCMTARGEAKKIAKAVIEKRKSMQERKRKDLQYCLIDDMKSVDFDSANCVDTAAQRIAAALSDQGLAIVPGVLPMRMVESLARELKSRREQVCSSQNGRSCSHLEHDLVSRRLAKLFDILGTRSAFRDVSGLPTSEQAPRSTPTPQSGAISYVGLKSRRSSRWIFSTRAVN